MRPFLSRQTNCHFVIIPTCQHAMVITISSIYFIIAKWAALIACPTAVNVQQYYTIPLFTIKLN